MTRPTRKSKIALYVAGGLVLFAAAAAALGLLVQLLWNRVLIDIVELPPISYWQALGIYLLAKLFFGFMPAGGGGQRQASRRRRPAAEPAAAGDAPAADDPAFREYWDREGRTAFANYLADRQPPAES